MTSLIMTIIFAIIALVLIFIPISGFDPIINKAKKLVGYGIAALAAVIGISGSISYNDAGKCTYVQTIFGSEDSTCSTGWYFSGWGRTTEWPQYITIAHTNAKNAEMSGSSINPRYQVRLSDNWNAEVEQASRFEIPKDHEQFMSLHKTFRSPERLISTVLKPAVTSSLDSVANLFSMEEYYAGGKRDQFKTEFRDAVTKGRAKVKQEVVDSLTTATTGDAKANTDTEDTSTTNNIAAKKIIMVKVTDENGNVIREQHDYVKFGIAASSAIVETLDPDDRFENQIQARKDAASRRIVAQEQRREQEEQRLLAIQTGETEIAKRQAAAKVEQIQKTTDAETAKKLAIIQAEQIKEQANIEKETASINLERDQLAAKSKKVLADAEAYAKKAIIVADGALEKKLEAYVQAQSVWAAAATQMNVPTNVFGGTNGSTNGVSSAEALMQMLSVKTAKDLQLDMEIKQ